MGMACSLHLLLLYFTYLLLLPKSGVAFSAKSIAVAVTKDQESCTMCSECENPCQIQPSPPPPMDKSSSECPPPPPPAPSCSNCDQQPPSPPQNVTPYPPEGGPFAPPPPVQSGTPNAPSNGGVAPPPPNPILPYFPFYYYYPPPAAAAANVESQSISLSTQSLVPSVAVVSLSLALLV